MRSKTPKKSVAIKGNGWVSRAGWYGADVIAGDTKTGRTTCRGG